MKPIRFIMKIRRHTNTIRAKREAANTGKDFMWDTVTTQQ